MPESKQYKRKRQNDLYYYKYLSCEYIVVKNCSTVSNPLRTNILNTLDAIQNIFKLLFMLQ
jgi:hypothetical protein